MTRNRRNAGAWRIYWLAIIAFFWLIATTPWAKAQDFVRLGDAESGALLLKTNEAGQYLEAPQVAADVAIEVTGPIIRTRITQRFDNPSDQWVEGVYVFPLPEDSGVDRLKMRIGERFIEGEIKERAEARRIYEEAREAGQRAGLVEQERPNLFTTSVANIGPGESVIVQIEYQDTAKLQDGWWSLRLPLVVGPRYSPEPNLFVGVNDDGRPDFDFDDPVPDRDRITPPVLHPDDEPNDRLRLPVAISVDLKPGFALGEIESPYHVIDTRMDDDDRRARIRLGEGEIPANRDFALRWRAADLSLPQTALFYEEWNGETYVLGIVAPPARAPIAPPKREIVFVIDNSGSMAGASMPQAKKALDYALSRLKHEDEFNIIRFDDTWERLFPTALPASSESVGFAQRFVDNLSADGGTEMLPALEAALADADPDDGLLRQVVFLTDGAIGNEAQMFKTIERDLGETRLFTVGIGSAPNAYFMTRAARMGRGATLQIGDLNEVSEKASALLAKLENPALTGLSVEAGGALSALWPNPLPDVYSGEPVAFTARLGETDTPILVSGRFNNRVWAETLDMDRAIQGTGVAALWARDQIEGIEALRFAPRTDFAAIDAAVLETALEFSLVSRLTSLVAVDKTPARPDGEPVETRDVPTMLPEGWDFGSVFGEAAPPPPSGPQRAGFAPSQMASLKAAPAPMDAAEAELAADAGLPLPQGALLIPLRMALGLALIIAALGALALAYRLRRPWL